jgi:hypothetical protein
VNSTIPAFVHTDHSQKAFFGSYMAATVGNKKLGRITNTQLVEWHGPLVITGTAGVVAFMQLSAENVCSRERGRELSTLFNHYALD